MRFQGVFYPVFLAITVGVFHSAAGEPSAPTNTTSTWTNDASDFNTLVKRGDQAQQKRDYIAAIQAYRDALAVRVDTHIEGRLGLVLFELREFHIAAQYLQHAVEKPAKSVTDAEYTKFSSAFRAAQKEVCRIDIEVDRRGTRLEVDGDFVQEGKGEFWFFVMPGRHKLRVSFEGFEDEIQEIEAPKGDQKLLKFVMRPIAKPAAETEKSAPLESQPAPKKNEPITVPEDKPTSKTNKTSRGRFVLGGGVALVLGPTPNPALGPQIYGAWRSRTWWEIGLDARVGWMVAEDKRFPGTQFVTWSFGMTPCGRLRARWFGCVMLGVDGMMSDARPKAALLPSFGFRGGYEFVLREHVGLQVFGDFIVRPDEFEFERVMAKWNASLVGAALGVRVVYKF